ncbi:MAG TPA: NAD(P)/FAD-dependent oxidoreductase [Candidatus Dormibacteraeota bacterium]|nr:NAD(P)/FAD-dependent oxidoreductase [Candidatus Dormibacteraeota bacterium]
MYDVIVVGARVAGSSTAMLLARRGLKVLAVDRARFPSDTLSTHQVQVPGAARLRRWGLLERVEAAGTPATRRVRFDPGPVVLEGHFPEVDGVGSLYSPRRTILDALLVDAAREAGAEVREGFTVEEILFDGDRVVGVRGRERGGQPARETARLVIGADGRHSAVARAVRAPAYHVQPPRSIAYYTYWSGVPMRGGEIYGRERRLIGAWPTNDGLVVTYVAAPRDEFGAFRADPEGSLLRSLDAAGDLGERVRAGERAERVFGSAELHNRFHRPFGPGWALVGDAGLLLDPVTGQGIADAFRDAELLAEAVATGLDGGPRLDIALDGYRARRDAASLPMYELTLDLASFAPPRPEQRLLFEALEGRPAEVDRFLGVLGGVVPIREYFGPRNLLRLLGPRRMLKAALAGRRMAG